MRQITRLSALFLLALSVGCIRDIPDLPDPTEGGFITGQIVQRDPQSGTLVPREGVRVRATSWSGSVLSDENGYFELRRLALGAVQVVAELRDLNGKVVSGAYRNANLLSDAQVYSVGVMRIDEDSTLTGKIVDARTATSSVGSIPGAIAAVVGTPFQAVGDVNAFSLRAIAPGTFDVAGYAANLAPGLRRDVQARPGERVEISDIELTSLAGTASIAVEGTVILDDGADPTGTTVELREMLDPDSLATASAASSGAFSASVLPGMYRVSFTKEGYIPLAIPNVLVTADGIYGLGEPRLAVGPAGDMDGDGVADAQDDDRDNDGCANGVDGWPEDPRYCLDGDGDGIPDELETDADGDDTPDLLEACASNPDCDPDRTDPDSQRGDNSTPLVVTDFSPKQISAHRILTVRGTGFGVYDRTYLELAPGDTARRAYEVLPNGTGARFQVPSGAQTGTFAVISEGSRWTSSEALTLVANSDVIARVEPNPVVAGGAMAIYANLDPEVEVQVSFDDNGTPQAPNASCTADQISAAQAGERAICMRAPAAAMYVTLAYGGDSDSEPISVVRGPVVTQILPREIEAGTRVRISGTDLTTLPNVQVRFPGVSSPVDVLVGATELVVESAPAVPTSVEQGELELVWSGGSQTIPLTVSFATNTPAVSDMYPLYLQAGHQSVFVYGTNLDQVTAVPLPGGIPAENVQGSGSLLTFDVPSNFGHATGTLEFTSSDGTTLTSPFRAGAIETSTVVDVGGVYYSGLAASGSGFTVISGATARLLSTTGALSRPVPVSGSSLSIPVPGLDRVVDLRLDGLVSLVEVSSRGLLDASCVLPGLVNNYPHVHTSPDGQWIYVVRTWSTGMAYVSFAVDGSSCSVWEGTPSPSGENIVSGYNGMVGEDLLLLGTAGWATINLRPNDGISDGRIIQGWTAAEGRPVVHTRYFGEYRGSDVIFVLQDGGFRLSGGLAKPVSRYERVHDLRGASSRFYTGSTASPSGPYRCYILDRATTREVGFIELEHAVAGCAMNVPGDHLAVSAYSYPISIFRVYQP